MFYHIFLGNFRHSLSADNPEDFFLLNVRSVQWGGPFLMTNINFENRSFRSMRRSENDWMRGISKYVCNFELKYVTFYKNIQVSHSLLQGQLQENHPGQVKLFPPASPSNSGRSFNILDGAWRYLALPKCPPLIFVASVMNSLGWKTKKMPFF